MNPMAKATRVLSTPRQTASKIKPKKAAPRKGLAFINAARQRKSAAEPNLKRELKMRRQPEDVENLAALYDAYMAAVDAMISVANRPRAAGVDDVNATATAWENLWEETPDELDHEHLLVRDLIESVCALAGIDLAARRFVRPRDSGGLN